MSSKILWGTAPSQFCCDRCCVRCTDACILSQPITTPDNALLQCFQTCFISIWVKSFVHTQCSGCKSQPKISPDSLCTVCGWVKLFVLLTRVRTGWADGEKKKQTDWWVISHQGYFQWLQISLMHEFLNFSVNLTLFLQPKTIFPWSCAGKLWLKWPKKSGSWPKKKWVICDALRWEDHRKGQSAGYESLYWTYLFITYAIPADVALEHGCLLPLQLPLSTVLMHK